MNAAWRSIEPDKIKDNPFSLIGETWMLVTAGEEDSWNTMTASWGGLGILWHKNVAFCFVRPTRHTYDFMEKADKFTLSFFSEQYRKALNYCGSHSGRDVDKAKETGLTPVPVDSSIAFKEARLVLVCQKIYSSDITPDNFLDKSIDKNYPLKDYHRCYIGEISSCYSE